MQLHEHESMKGETAMSKPVIIRCRDGRLVRLEGDFNTALIYVRSLQGREYDKEREEWRVPLPTTIVVRRAPKTLQVTIQEPLQPMIIVPVDWRKGEWNK